MTRGGKTPQTVVSGDRMSVGQVAEQLGKSGSFVRAEIAAGHLVPDPDGRIPNAEMCRWYRDHGTLLD